MRVNTRGTDQPFQDPVDPSRWRCVHRNDGVRQRRLLAWLSGWLHSMFPWHLLHNSSPGLRLIKPVGNVWLQRDLDGSSCSCTSHPRFHEGNHSLSVSSSTKIQHARGPMTHVATNGLESTSKRGLPTRRRCSPPREPLQTDGDKRPEQHAERY